MRKVGSLLWLGSLSKQASHPEAGEASALTAGAGRVPELSSRIVSAQYVIKALKVSFKNSA